MTATIASNTAAGTNDAVKIDFFAPTGSTFRSNDVTWVKRNNAVEVQRGTTNVGCTLVSSSQITCEWSGAGNLYNAPQANADLLPDQYYILPIQVNANAPFNTRFD
ncbi:hypothetical protein ACTGWE_11690, partial [Streptococcus suis]